MTFATAALVLGGLGSAVSAVGSIAQGNAAANADAYNAAVQRQQAQEAKDAAAAESQDYTRDNMRKVASAEAARGATGVTMTGSPLLVDEDTVREVALGASRIGYQGALQANRYSSAADLSQMRESSDRTAGYIGAGSSLLSGLGKAFGSASPQYVRVG